MKKQELHDFLIGLASAGMETMIETGGSCPQRVVAIDYHENIHGLHIGEPLTGRMLAVVLEQFAQKIGGADVIAVQADAKMKAFKTRAEAEAMARDYSPAKDPASVEVLITAGRSREHRAVILCPYERTTGDKKDIIVFKIKEPKVEQCDTLGLFAIPDVWGPVN